MGIEERRRLRDLLRYCTDGETLSIRGRELSRADIMAMVCRLPPQQRTAVQTIADGATINRVARNMDVAPRTVKRLLQRAFMALEQAITP